MFEPRFPFWTTIFMAGRLDGHPLSHLSQAGGNQLRAVEKMDQREKKELFIAFVTSVFHWSKDYFIISRDISSG